MYESERQRSGFDNEKDRGVSRRMSAAQFAVAMKTASVGEQQIVKMKVLIVDDDAALRQQLYWMLCDDYEVTTAHDLQSAMRGAMIYEPQVAILDLHLPPAADTPEVGLHVLEYLKEQRPAAKVLVVSSDGGAGVRMACARRGADAFLSKPFEAESLLSTVHHTSIAARLGEI
jgi:DNA-binding response OmpR family regulator